MNRYSDSGSPGKKKETKWKSISRKKEWNELKDNPEKDS